MFDNLQKVKIYKESLELLADLAIINKEVWLHDYHWDTGFDKSKEGKFREAYIDSLVDDITGKKLEGVRSHFDAKFVGEPMEDWEKWNYADNSRFSRVKYTEIKQEIGQGIHKKLQQAKINAQGDVKALADWKKHIKKKYANYLDSSLRIEVIVDESIKKIYLVALKPERFNTYGFGSFLENVQKGEISISPAVLDVLSKTPYRSGMMGLELFANNILSMIGTKPELIVHPNYISMGKSAHEWLRKVARVED